MNGTDNYGFKGDILIVDDTLENLKLLSNILKNNGYKVRAVTNGKIALNAAFTKAPDLILLDINMPEINGYQVCERLKASPQTNNIPVIFLSALDEPLNKVKAFSVGGADYITKPFQIEEVLIRIENQLQACHSQKLIAKQNLILQEKNEKLLMSEALLRKKSESLEKTLAELKQAQLQIIQSEKMAGLGQLAAGVAHEINNSITFIYGNLDYANTSLEELLYLVKLYQQEYPNSSEEIQNFLAEIDIDFLSVDLPKMISSMEKGADRIRKIVASLGNFSGINEAKFKSVDIQEGIESSLLLLQSKLEAKPELLEVEIIKQYSQLPPLTCYHNQLNQVFFNLLNNAVDALEIKRQKNIENHQDLHNNLPTIWITTEQINQENIIIKIADNGAGMNESVQKHIFEPFFTTKTIGKGTGLGLSISYQIVVEQHQGKLTCASVLDKGSTFMIEIPLRQKESSSC